VRRQRVALGDQLRALGLLRCDERGVRCLVRAEPGELGVGGGDPLLELGPERGRGGGADRIC
jgi:hypothetical protein